MVTYTRSTFCAVSRRLTEVVFFYSATRRLQRKLWWPHVRERRTKVLREVVVVISGCSNCLVYKAQVEAVEIAERNVSNADSCMRAAWFIGVSAAGVCWVAIIGGAPNVVPALAAVSAFFCSLLYMALRKLLRVLQDVLKKTPKPDLHRFCGVDANVEHKQVSKDAAVVHEPLHEHGQPPEDTSVVYEFWPYGETTGNMKQGDLNPVLALSCPGVADRDHSDSITATDLMDTDCSHEGFVTFEELHQYGQRYAPVDHMLNVWSVLRDHGDALRQLFHAVPESDGDHDFLNKELGKSLPNYGEVAFRLARALDRLARERMLKIEPMLAALHAIAKYCDSPEKQGVSGKAEVRAIKVRLDQLLKELEVAGVVPADDAFPVKVVNFQNDLGRILSRYRGKAAPSSDGDDGGISSPELAFGAGEVGVESSSPAQEPERPVGNGVKLGSLGM